MKRLVLSLFVGISTVAPSRAQATKPEPAFFIIFNSLTKKCTVVDKMPQTDTPNITLASDTIFQKRRKQKRLLRPFNLARPNVPKF